MTRRVFLAIMWLLIGSASLTTASNAVAADASVFMNQLWGQTVTQQIHGKPVGTTASWSNPASRNSGTIKLLKKFTAKNMRCEEIGYALVTTAGNVSPEHYVLDSCLQPDGSWKIL